MCWLVHFICSVYLLSCKCWEFLQLYLLTNSISSVLEELIFVQLVKKLPTILWQPRVILHVHMNLPLAFILIYINPIYNPWSLSSRSVSTLSCCLSLVLPHDLIPSSFWTRFHIHFAFTSCLLPALFVSSWSVYPDNIMHMKHLITQFSPSSNHFLPLSSKYSPLPLFSSTSVCVLPSMWEPIAHTHNFTTIS
jgi:hypothetical protein